MAIATAFVAVLPVLPGLPGSARADVSNALVRTLTLEDLDTSHQAELSMPMVPGDEFFGVAIRIRLRLGLTENMSLSVGAPLAMDGGDVSLVGGTPNLNVLFRKCEESLCLGAALQTSVGFWQAEDDERPIIAMAQAAHQSEMYYSYENLALQPKLIAALSRDGWITQADVGGVVAIPLANTDGRETEVRLLYQAGVGRRFFDLVAPVVEFRGLTPLTDGGQAAYWINSGLRFWLGENLQTAARISVPLNDAAQWDDAPVQWELGSSYRF